MAESGLLRYLFLSVYVHLFFWVVKYTLGLVVFMTDLDCCLQFLMTVFGGRLYHLVTVFRHLV